MELINFINQHINNWEEILTAPPYCLHIKHENNYVLIKYDMILSDFNYKLCKEARGIIINKGIDNKWHVAAQGLDKFFNYNEAYSDLKEIDWNNCTVSEKIDGTNIRIYMNDSIWHISTLGCVNAFKAEFIEGITYGDLVIEACGGTLEKLTDQLNPLYCYYFELTGPNRIVINYGEKPMLWYLGRRNMITLKEDFTRIEFNNIKIYYPGTYNVKSLQTCINNAANMGNDEEGYVVTSIDNNGIAHRIKIKGQEYLRLHKLRCNGILTITRVISMWRDGTLDDYMSSFPDYNDFINKIFEIIKSIVEEMENGYKVISTSNRDRKSMAIAAKTWISPIPAYLFARLDNKVTNATQFIEQMPINKLASIIMPRINRFSVGIAEDE